MLQMRRDVQVHARESFFFREYAKGVSYLYRRQKENVQERLELDARI